MFASDENLFNHFYLAALFRLLGQNSTVISGGLHGTEKAATSLDF